MSIYPEKHPTDICMTQAPHLNYEVTQTEKKVTFTKKNLLMKNGKPFKVKDGTLGDEYTRRYICEKYGYPKWMSIGILEMDSLRSFIDTGLQIMKEPDKFIGANYGSDFEIQPERGFEGTDGKNTYSAGDEEIDDELEEESRKQNAWDMYYGLGH